MHHFQTNPDTNKVTIYWFMDNQQYLQTVIRNINCIEANVPNWLLKTLHPSKDPWMTSIAPIYWVKMIRSSDKNRAVIDIWHCVCMYNYLLYCYTRLVVFLVFKYGQFIDGLIPKCSYIRQSCWCALVLFQYEVSLVKYYPILWYFLIVERLCLYHTLIHTRFDVSK